MSQRLLSCAFLLVSVFATAEERTLLILHTNDLHDHVRPDYDGSGGFAYVAGYIQKVKAEREDVLVLDAGDVMEKGDLAVYRDQSRMMYEAMGRAGFDAGAPGNHDDAYGDEHLEACAKLAEPMRMLAINLLRPEGELLFPASHIFERNGLRIGVIGVFKPRDEGSLDLDQTARAVAIEAARLESESDIQIVVAHLGPKDCEVIAKQAPTIDVFVSGHTHQALERPIAFRETGALAVQAGSYAEYVGRLELVVNTESGEIVSHDGNLISMNHADVERDDSLQSWFDEKESELAPEAGEFVASIDTRIGYRELTYLGAEGIRRLAQADIGFCHSAQIIRDTLPVGDVDVNAVFRTGGQRGYDNVTVSLSGAQIAAYVEGLANSGWGKTIWSGFRGVYRETPSGVRFHHDLEADRAYAVVMPLKEWDTRFVRFFEHENSPIAFRHLAGVKPEKSSVTFTDGVVALIRSENGSSVAAIAARIENAALLVGE